MLKKSVYYIRPIARRVKNARRNAHDLRRSVAERVVHLVPRVWRDSRPYWGRRSPRGMHRVRLAATGSRPQSVHPGWWRCASAPALTLRHGAWIPAFARMTLHTTHGSPFSRGWQRFRRDVTSTPWSHTQNPRPTAQDASKIVRASF